MTIIRIAWSLVRSPEHGARLRWLAVPMSSATFALGLLVCLSLIAMSVREADRYDARRPWVQPPGVIAGAPDDLWMVLTSDKILGETITVVWLQPVGSSSVSAAQFPPGIEYLPPGGAAVSPGLFRLLEDRSDLLAPFADARGNYQTIGNAGVVDGNELLVYWRPPESYDLSTHRFAVRVTGFGPDAEGALPETGIGLGRATAGQISSRSFGIAVVALLLLPTVVLLVVTHATGAAARERRLQLLQAIGISRNQFMSLWAIEGILLSLAAVLVGWLLWFIGWRNVTTVPLIDHRVLPRRAGFVGDFDLPGHWVYLALFGAVMVPMLVSIVIGVINYQLPVRFTRFEGHEASLSWWRLTPLGLLVVAFLAQEWLGGERGATTMLAIVMLVLLLLPLMMPQLIGIVGRGVRSLRWVPLLLTGRGLEHDASGNSRTVLGIAVLISIGLSAIGLRALLTTEEPPIPEQVDTSAILVFSESPDPIAEQEAMSTALPDALVVRADALDPTTLRIAATCDDIVQFFPGTSCDPNTPRTLPTFVTQQINEAVGTPGGRVELTPSVSAVTSSPLFILSDKDYPTFVESVRAAARQHLLITTVNDRGGGAAPVKAARWLGGALPLPIFILTIATLLAQADRFVNLKRHRTMLLEIGLIPRQLAILDTLQYLLTMVVAIGLGGALGIFTVMRIMVAFPDTQTPWLEMVILLGGGVLIGTLVGIVVLVAGTQRFSRSD